jgi:hypothetical protein
MSTFVVHKVAAAIETLLPPSHESSDVVLDVLRLAIELDCSQRAIELSFVRLEQLGAITWVRKQRGPRSHGKSITVIDRASLRAAAARAVAQ